MYPGQTHQVLSQETISCHYYEYFAQSNGADDRNQKIAEDRRGLPRSNT